MRYFLHYKAISCYNYKEKKGVLTMKTKKIALLFLTILALASCNGKNSNNQESIIDSIEDNVSNDSIDGIISNDDDSTDVIRPVGEEVEIRYDLTSAVDSLSSSYESVKLVCDDAAFAFDNVSQQSKDISNAPVINSSANKGNNYVEMLSDAPFDLTHIGIEMTIFSQGDLEKMGNMYDYIGMEYLVDDEWIKAGETITPNLLNVGPLSEKDSLYIWEVEHANVRHIRLSFEGMPSDPDDSSFKIRFGLYSMYIKGIKETITTNKTTTSVTINAQSDILAINKSLQLTATALASDGMATPILWESSNRSIATVDENGLVKGVMEGTAVIKATSGNVYDELSIQVVSDENSLGYIQTKVLFVDYNNMPEGFTTNSEETYGEGALKLYETGHYIKTPKYEVVNCESRVTIEIKHSSGNPEAKDNILSVVGYDENGEEVERVKKVGLMNTNYEEVNFDFTNRSICQYELIYELKAMGDSYPAGKNYGVRSMQIIKLK